MPQPAVSFRAYGPLLQVIAGCLTGRIAGTKVDQTHKAKLIRMILATEARPFRALIR